MIFKKDDFALKFLIDNIKKRGFYFFLFVLIPILSSLILTIFSPLIAKKLTDYLSTENQVLKVGISYILFYSFIENVDYLKGIIARKLHITFMMKSRVQIFSSMFRHTLKHSISYFNNSFAGKISNKILGASFRAYARICDDFTNIVAIIIGSIAVLFLYAKVSFYIAIFFIIMVIFVLLLASNIQKKINVLEVKYNEADSSLYGIMGDIFANIRNVKIFSNENNEKKTINENCDKVLNCNLEILLLRKKDSLITSILNFFFLFTPIGVTAYLLSKNKITLGSFMFVLMTITTLRRHIYRVKHAFGTIGENYSKFKDSVEFILKPIEINDKKDAIKLNNVVGKISFRNIIFAHEREEKKDE
jgi:ABC-type multidrug transport system fused ATPase/permease subunit